MRLFDHPLRLVSPFERLAPVPREVFLRFRPLVGLAVLGSNRPFLSRRQAGFNSTFWPASLRFSSTKDASQRLEITAVSLGFCKAQR